MNEPRNPSPISQSIGTRYDRQRKRGVLPKGTRATARDTRLSEILAILDRIRKRVLRERCILRLDGSLSFSLSRASFTPFFRGRRGLPVGAGKGRSRCSSRFLENPFTSVPSARRTSRPSSGILCISYCIELVFTGQREKVATTGGGG